MKTSLKVTLPALALMAVLTGCSTVDSKKAEATPAAAPAAPAAQAQAPAQAQGPAVFAVNSIDGKKEVAYRCGKKHNLPLTAMYGFKDGQVVVAQVRYQGKVSPGLFRLVDNSTGNIFINNGISWRTATATPATVDKVNGNSLEQTVVETVNGQQTPVKQVVASECVLDKVATAKLARAAQAKAK